jgi:uncharacterized 2Fe-2S/4Fe-4S cluster protein (DUF4445 family)
VRESGVTPCGISSFAIVGNTIMLHLFLGASVDGIVRAPFTPTFTDAQDVAALEIGLPFPNARAYTLPCVSAMWARTPSRRLLPAALIHMKGSRCC